MKMHIPFAARLIVTAALMLLCSAATAAPADSTRTEKSKGKPVKRNADGEIIKTGYNFGPLPVVAYDADKGFQYGALLNIYNFGDGSTYPEPRSSWYIEASAYTKGSQKYIVSYDNRHLIKGIRICAAASLMADKAMEFFGFNGYQSIYDPEIHSGFYRFNRLTANFKADFIGKITDGLSWEAGYHFNYFRTGNFTTGEYELETTLFQLYKDWGIIPGDLADGGISSALRAGLVYDTRDYEGAPSRGIWAEAHFIAAPRFLGSSAPYYKVSATFRHYVPLFRDRLTFAYRLNYQGFVGVTPPWYVMPYLTVVGPMYDRDAIGGYRSVRGLLMDRVQAPHTAFWNAEIRWKFVSFQLFRQNITLALNAFCDGAAMLKGADLSNRTGAESLLYGQFVAENTAGRLHAAAGAGFRFIMNRNFIVAVEYARCIDPRDGSNAFYVNTGYLF